MNVDYKLSFSLFTIIAENWTREIAWNLALKSCSQMWAKCNDTSVKRKKTKSSFEVLPTSFQPVMSQDSIKIAIDLGIVVTWQAICRFFFEMVSFFTLDKYFNPIFCSRIAQKSKNCSKLLKPQEVAPNTKSLNFSKVAKHNRNGPNDGR